MSQEAVPRLGLHQAGDEFTGGVGCAEVAHPVVVDHDLYQAVEVTVYVLVVEQVNIFFIPCPFLLIQAREILIQPIQCVLNEAIANFQGHALGWRFLCSFWEIDVHQFRCGHHHRFTRMKMKGLFGTKVHDFLSLNHAHNHGVVKNQVKLVGDTACLEHIEHSVVCIVRRSVLNFNLGAAENLVLLFEVDA